MSIETRFDIPFIAAMALREKQIQQNYRPIIAVHKWFARRPGTLFRGLALAEFGTGPLRDIFFSANDFPGKRVYDPFMGGGTPLLEANRIGCDVLGFDINPMATWIVREEIEHLDLDAYRTAASTMLSALTADIGGLYRTSCPHYGDADVPVKYALWVKAIDCTKCGKNVDLFPGHLIADDTRHPLNALVCHACGDLNKVADLKQPGKCRSCRSKLVLEGTAKRNRCACRHCGHVNRYPDGKAPLRHRLFAIEYYNPHRKAEHAGRFFKRPDANDLARVADAERRWKQARPRFVPSMKILAGDETDRLHRWGYRRYREMFNDRQLLGLERSCQIIAGINDERVRHALATNLSDLLRYQNMLCRYDTMALKSLDIFSVHGFPVGLVQCESNLLGITNGNGTSVGSGGWANIIEKYAKAKRYCEAPFEVRQVGSRKIVVPIEGEWIGERMPQRRTRDVAIHCASSTTYRSGGGIWRDEQYPVRIERTPCNKGGSRHWFICPAVGCGRRVAILYGGRIFACRRCHQLAYASSREDAGDRSTRRADRLRARLGWEPGILNGEGGKPKWMRWRTFERLAAEHDAFVGQSLAAMAVRFGIKHSSNTIATRKNSVERFQVGGLSGEGKGKHL